MKIWTYRKAPFRLGGTTETMAAEVGEPAEFAGFLGYSIYAFKSPLTGRFHVAEGESGALVGLGDTAGSALASVIADIAQGDPEIMRQQVADAKRKGEQPDVTVEAEEFWHCLRKEGS